MSVAECPENSTLEVCDLLDESGTGLGIFLERLRPVLIKFLIGLGIVSAILLIVGGIVVVIKKGVSMK